MPPTQATGKYIEFRLNRPLTRQEVRQSGVIADLAKKYRGASHNEGSTMLTVWLRHGDYGPDAILDVIKLLRQSGLDVTVRGSTSFNPKSER